MASFYGWVPDSMDKLKIMVSASGWAACTHFRMQYLILLGPRADELVAVCRVSEISLVVMGGHSLLGRGSGSLGWQVLMDHGFTRKKWLYRTLVFCSAMSTRALSAFQSGG